MLGLQASLWGLLATLLRHPCRACYDINETRYDMGKSVSRPGYVELDPKRLYNQVQATKDVLDLGWSEIWEKTGVTKSSLDKLKRGKTVEATTMMRLMVWLGILNIEHFSRRPE